MSEYPFRRLFTFSAALKERQYIINNDVQFGFSKNQTLYVVSEQFSEKSMDINCTEPQVKFIRSGEKNLDLSTS